MFSKIKNKIAHRFNPLEWDNIIESSQLLKAKIGLNQKKVVNNGFNRIKTYDSYRNYGIYDTSIGSDNIGDYIIMESIQAELNDLFSQNARLTTFPTHFHLGGTDRFLLQEKELLFVCGTNLLNNNMYYVPQWKISPSDISFIYKRCVLLGVGWQGYGGEITNQTADILHNVLSDTALHSVRDEYTKQKLATIGIKNVINTSCPTTWRIDNSNFLNINKKNKVVCTITDYCQDIERDRLMLETLVENYSEVSIWIQSIEDVTYLETLNPNNLLKLNFIPPSLTAYKQYLAQNIDDIDYIGTRLHAGIFALQRGIRSIIIEIDNRAKEIAKDINLPTIPRSEIVRLNSMINSDFNIKLQTPKSSIVSWKEQFS